ncbi:MAG: hypothetical protein QW215_05950 [Ignisphaera sp.]
MWYSDSEISLWFAWLSEYNYELEFVVGALEVGGLELDPFTVAKDIVIGSAWGS